MGTFGTIRFERLGRNRVQASASFRDPDGRRRHVLRTGPTRAQAERLLREALRDRANTAAPPLPADSRLSAMAAQWLAGIDASDLAIGTKRLYRFAVQSYVLPGLGELLLRELTVTTVDRLFTAVAAQHGPAAAKSTRSVLSGILGLAVRHGLLPTNPVRDAPARRTGRSQRRLRALSSEDVDLLRARLAADAAAVRRDLPDLVDFLLGTGLRIGEACALRPADVDLNAGTLSVTGTVIRQPGRGLLIQDVPKTGAGRRTIPLPARTLDLLRRRLADLPSQEGDPVLFPSPNGHLRDPSNTSGDLRQALDRAGLPWVTSHTFRKTVATRLDDARLSARQIADHLGHSRPSLTQDVYLARGTASLRTAAAIRRVL
ncbi:tyrosine recombinase XerC [Blastococcus sp. SYSU D00669]